MRDAFWDLSTGSRCLGCDAPGRPLCPGCAEALAGLQVFLAGPDPPPPGLVPVLAATEYAGVLRRMILRHKEDQAFVLAKPLGQVLAVPLGAVLAGWPAGARPVLVPVPSRPAVVRRRGHDPLLRVVRAAAQRLADPPPVARLLRHRGRTADQSGLDAAGRALNLRGALVVAPRAVRRLVRAGPVAAVICDDVITTGATARESQRALEGAGVPVAAVVVVAATRRRHPSFS